MVTIIITAYNVSKTIGRAIESCLAQTFKDIEVLIINDCSTDDTQTIIEGYKDKRIRLINNTVNQGAGISRQIGLDNIKGEYTIFLDGDDWFDDNYVETLYNEITKTNADIVSCGQLSFDENYNYISGITYDKYEIKTGIQCYNEHIRLRWFLNNKIINAKLWEKVKYSPRRFVEDTQTCFMILFYAQKVVNLPNLAYNYYQNMSSLCHTSSDVKKKIYGVLCAKDICVFIKEHFPVDVYIFELNGFITHLLRLNSIIEEKDLEHYCNEIQEIKEFIQYNENFFNYQQKLNIKKCTKVTN